MNFEVIRAAMQEEIDNPQAFYIPCGPGEYIRDRLFKQSYWEEAVWFWNHYCSKNFGVAELDSLIPELIRIAAKDKMPEWGYKGT